MRSRLAASLIDYHTSLQQAQILQQEVLLRREIVAMLEARLNAGLISSIEMSNARLQLQRTEQALDVAKARAPELLSQLASNVGLPAASFKALKLKEVDISSATLHWRQDADNIQQAALLNRVDIRAALAHYDAAEAKLRLEIAKQYPDFTLSPGYSFDQDDRIWSTRRIYAAGSVG